MQKSYTHYVFQTLTYNREGTCRHQSWYRVARDTSAYIQSVRRKFKSLGSVEFLRVIEPHEDYYPHVHTLLWFESSLVVNNGKYFDRRFYDMLQCLWRRGYSKPEVLRKPDAFFAYCLKYFLKQIADKDPLQDEQSKTSDVPKMWLLRGKRLTWFGMPIRILAWSRGMQYLYCNEQRRSLKRKGFNLSLPDKLVLPKIAKRNFLPFDTQASGEKTAVNERITTARKLPK